MFDLDGTLADTGHDLADSVNFTRAHFDLAPLPEQSITPMSAGASNICSSSRCRRKLRVIFDEVMRVFLAHYETHLLDQHGALSGRA